MIYDLANNEGTKKPNSVLTISSISIISFMNFLKLWLIWIYSKYNIKNDVPFI